MTRTAAGDHAAETAATNFTSTTSSWWFMDDLSVATDTQLGAVVALGDSITDDANGTSNTNHRWPDFLASRLTSGVVRGVLDEGISGNSILKDYNCCGGNPSALSRLDRDVLSHDGVRTVIVLLGINDLGNYPDDQSNVADIEDGMRQLADRIHRAGVRIEMGTITPFQNATLPGYYDAAKEAKREQLNAFIRSAPYWDGVVDFEKALQDPSNPLMMLPAYDSGDHLHPNDAGNQALANAVQWVESPVIGVSTPAEPVGGTVPATLALAMGPNPSFGAFIPGLAKTYTASTTATVTSTAADATLSVSDPGHLTNGTFALPQPLQVGPLPSWDGPVSNDVKTITFSQAIGASDALRTGTYATTVTFTLSTTSP
jgi:lysophospholipase L1-like esterase